MILFNTARRVFISGRLCPFLTGLLFLSLACVECREKRGVLGGKRGQARGFGLMGLIYYHHLMWLRKCMGDCIEGFLLE